MIQRLDQEEVFLIVVGVGKFRVNFSGTQKTRLGGVSPMTIISRFRYIFLLPAAIFAAALFADENPATTLEPFPDARFDKICERMSQGNVDLLWVGDSIVNGFVNGPGAKIFHERYDRRNSMSIAIGGMRTGHVLWEFDNAPVDRINPKMAVVMIGTNNVGHGKSTPAQTAEGIEAIIDRLRDLYPEMKILLLEVFPRDPNPGDDLRRQVEEINALIRPIYGEGKVKNVKLYSINDLFLTEEGVLTREMMRDYLHPTELGYDIWGKAVEPLIIEGLGEKPMEAVGEQGGDDWMARFNEKNDLLAANERDYRILMLGDSITHYWEKSAFDEQEALTPLWKRYYEDLGAINLGIAGDQTQNLVWRIEHYDFSKVHPRLAILMIGVNNIPTGHPFEATAYATRYIVKTIQEKCPGIKVIVLKCLPYLYMGRIEYQMMVDDYNALLPYYFRDLEDVELIDIGDMYRGEGGLVNTDFFPDRVHPNRDGYLLWGERLKSKVLEKIK